MAASIPVIEISDDADALGSGCPDSKAYTTDTVQLYAVGTQYPVDVPVTAFTEQVQVKVGYLWREAVGVVGHVLGAMTVAPDQAIAIRHLVGRPVPGKQVGIAHALQRGTVFGNAHPGGTWNIGANQVRVGVIVLA